MIVRPAHRATIAALLATVLVTGCVPYPVYKTLQPAASVTVLGPDQQPLANAEATLVARAHPSRFEQRRDTKLTLADGTARFDAVRELRVEVTAIHGSLEFYWNWCIRKDGYVTYRTHSSASDDFLSKLVVRLEPGQSIACPAPHQ